VLVRDGRIVAVGTDVAVRPAPRDRRPRQDGHAGPVQRRQLGLRRISAVQSNNEGRLSDNQVAAAFQRRRGHQPGLQLIR
jgi:hypothetical protein